MSAPVIDGAGIGVHAIISSQAASQATRPYNGQIAKILRSHEAGAHDVLDCPCAADRG
jgi:hypothetical protein